MDKWLVFGKPRQEFRDALKGLQRHIATVETAKHRVFQFLDASILPDNKLVVIASDEASHLGVLSSTHHVTWSLRAGGWLGVGNDPVYVKSRCFDPFPFPEASPGLREEIGGLAEELDALRKSRIEAHHHLTLTGLYNVVERLRSGQPPSELALDDARVLEDGLAFLVKELHDKIDAAVARAYGWPVDLRTDEVLARIVALNAERAREEARGQVRWLRPAYQAPLRLADVKRRPDQEQLEADLVAGKTAKPLFPREDLAQTAEVLLALAAGPASLGALSGRYRQGRRVEGKIEAVIAALGRVGMVFAEHGRFHLRRAA